METVQTELEQKDLFQGLGVAGHGRGDFARFERRSGSKHCQGSVTALWPHVAHAEPRGPDPLEIADERAVGLRGTFGEQRTRPQTRNQKFF